MGVLLACCISLLSCEKVGMGRLECFETGHKGGLCHTHCVLTLSILERASEWVGILVGRWVGGWVFRVNVCVEAGVITD